MKHQFFGVFCNDAEATPTFYTLPIAIPIDEFQDGNGSQATRVAESRARFQFKKVTEANSSQRFMALCDRDCNNDYAARLVDSLISGELTRKEGAAIKAHDCKEVRLLREDKLNATKHALACRACQIRVLYFNNPTRLQKELGGPATRQEPTKPFIAPLSTPAAQPSVSPSH